MVGPSAGRKARRAERAIGACADMVASVRDAAAAVTTFEGVRAALPVRMRAGTDGVRAALAERLRHEAQQLESPGKKMTGNRDVRKLRKALQRQQAGVEQWVPRGNGWRLVGPGVEAAYREARKTMARAYREPNGDTFHAWRRAVKAHRYQVRLLSSLAPDELEPRAKQLGQLAELLGEEHDLTLLRRALRANRFWLGEDGDTYYEVIRRIDQQRREKRVRAQPLGEQLFSERPSALVRRLRQHFREFRRAAAPVAAAA